MLVGRYVSEVAEVTHFDKSLRRGELARTKEVQGDRSIECFLGRMRRKEGIIRGQGLREFLAKEHVTAACVRGQQNQTLSNALPSLAIALYTSFCFSSTSFFLDSTVCESSANVSCVTVPAVIRLLTSHKDWRRASSELSTEGILLRVELSVDALSLSSSLMGPSMALTAVCDVLAECSRAHPVTSQILISLCLDF